MVYHFQTKFRDEPRSRGGLIRVREFVMKDAYTCDVDAAGLDVAYEKQYAAYTRIFERLGIGAIPVASDVGMMGGSQAHEFMFLNPAGEDILVLCEQCGFSANRQVATVRVSEPPAEEPLPLEEVETPGTATIADLAAYLGVDAERTAKATFFVADGDRFVTAIVRGDMEVNETKLVNAIKASTLRSAQIEEIRATGMVPGYASPIGARGALVVVDELVSRSSNLVAGANREGYHLRNVNVPRDYTPDIVADLSSAREGDGCPTCGSSVILRNGIEVGNIFKLGTKYTEALGATYLGEDGQEHPIVMGSYGIGVGRAVACIVEAHHDEKGIVWPAEVAPYAAHIVAIGASRDPKVSEVADALHDLAAARARGALRRPRRVARREVHGRRADGHAAHRHGEPAEPRGGWLRGHRARDRRAVRHAPRRGRGAPPRLRPAPPAVRARSSPLGLVDPSAAAAIALTGLTAIVLVVALVAGARGRDRARADAAEMEDLRTRVADAEARAAATRAGAAAGEPALVPSRATSPVVPGGGSAPAVTRMPDGLPTTIDALGEGVVRIDGDGVVVFANLAAHSLLDRRSGSLVGLTAVQAFLDHRVEDVIDLARSRGSATAELVPRISEGRQIVVRARRATGGDVWVVLEDVTDLRRLQRMRTEFIDNLSHELRTPITNVNLLAETLARGADELPPRARDRVERIQVEAAQLAQMVSELLDLAAIEGGQPLLLSDVDLAEVSRAQAERLRVFADRQGVEIVVEAPDAVPPVRGDAGRLGQAILNLVHNAVKFSDPGDRVVIRVTSSGDEVTVAVVDEGAGIPRADLGRVFERFYKVDRARQRAVGGTGLGLSIVHHVVEAHGGRIGVTSEEGVGSTFTITLPVQGPVVALATDAADDGLAGTGPEAAA